MTFKPIHDMLHNIKLHPGRKDKEKLIKDYLEHPQYGELFKQVITYALHPFKVYKTRNVSFLKVEDDDPYKVGQTPQRVLECLDFLAAKKGCTDLENTILSKFASMNKESVDVTQRIVTKDLKCGANIKTFKKFIPDIPEHNVMLCGEDLEKFYKQSNNFKNAVKSLKLDGVRCWSTVTAPHGVVTYQSRNGKEFPNFSIFDSYLRNCAAELYKKYKIDYPITFDGEVENKDKDFQNLMTKVRKLKGVDPKTFQFNVFDLVVTGKGFSDRFSMIKDVIGDETDYVKVLDHYQCTFETIKDVLEYTEKICDAGHEGIVLKITDSEYQFKRSNDWCKVKKMKTVDLKVVSIEEGTGKYEGILGALICEYNTLVGSIGYVPVSTDGTSPGKIVKVKVGSGFSDEERIEFFYDPPKMIEVKYQNETKDQSLRFPVFVKVREDLE